MSASFEVCDKCHARYAPGGDGFDRLCPSCADKAQEALDAKEAPAKLWDALSEILETPGIEIPAHLRADGIEAIEFARAAYPEFR